MNSTTITISKRPAAPRRPVVTVVRPAGGATPSVALPAQLMQYDTAGVSSPADAAAMHWLPAGAAQRTSYPAGRYTFRMAAQAFRTKPNIDTSTFPTYFARAVAALMPAGVTGTASVFAASDGPSVDPTGVTFVNREGPTWWVTVNGSINAPVGWSLTGNTGLNRAIARALAQATTLAPSVIPSPRLPGDSLPASYRPTDGGQLQTMLDHPEACTQGSGVHVNTSQMWMKACTAVTAAGEATPPNIPSVPPTPSTGGAPGPTATVTPLPTAPAPSACTVTIASQAWIRPTATFSHVGPNVPVGTQLVLLGRTNSTSGSMRLYRVRVASGEHVGLEGFAALDVSDTNTAAPTGCLTGVSASTELATVSTGGASPATTTAQPPAPRPAQTVTASPAAALSGGAGAASAVSGFPWGTFALTTGAVLVVGAAVINRDKIAKGFETGKARARTSYGTAKARYQSWRSK